MSPTHRIAALAFALAASACAGAPTTVADAPGPTVVRVADVDWQPLNPARGDASPRAATLWGDRDGSGPTGFLVRFADGFSSPPHIHNVSYRGVVISGLIHNADAAAEPRWMPTGSYWTQPRGGAHITAARGVSVAYIEIDEGPYLVRPVDAAFDAGEAPLNLHAADMAWAPASPAGGGRLAHLWGAPDAGPSGSLVALTADSAATLRSRGDLRAVLIAGRGHAPDAAAGPLDPGSGLTAGDVLRLVCGGDAPCLFFVGATGPLTVDEGRTGAADRTPRLDPPS